MACALFVGVAANLDAEAAAVENAQAGLESEYQELVRPFIETYCFACHGKDKPKGDFDLRPLTGMDSVAKDERRWKMILDQLAEKQMPPEEAKRHPTPELYQQVVTWIQRARAFEGRRNAGDPGVVLARRLNNAEFNNTIRDLTGVDIQPAREFPVDPANEAGFDNSGESLMMSPALVKKHLKASRLVAEHLILLPEGFVFAPFPALADTDRDKFGVRRIVEFYRRQPTDYADYFMAAWRYEQRVALGKSRATLASEATQAKVSPRYLATVHTLLTATDENTGPIAALQRMWRALPSALDREKEVRVGCDAMRDLVVKWREKVKVAVGNLKVFDMSSGSQSLVLWKDRQMAANRRTYGGGALELKASDLGLDPNDPAAVLLMPPSAAALRARYEDAFKRFAGLFPDAFYILERSRIFLNPGEEEKANTGRLLSAGFHNQMGYFRDDQPLGEMILDDAGRRELDRLWQEFDFASDVPMRMHTGFIWFERAESGFLRDTEFDFARAEDKDIASEAKFKKFADVYLAKVRRSTTNAEAIQAVEEHFHRSEAAIRRVEKARLAAEPSHLVALQEFAARAYRRALSATERDELAAFYHKLRSEEGLGHEEAVRDVLVSLLMSPDFTYRADLPSVATGKPGSVQPLSDDALASRLSYFLWSSMPDAELRRHAAAGDLHQPKILLAQTRRLLKSERVRGLALEFGGNWLDFRRFEEHNAVDRGRFPSFDNELRSAQFEEPVRFFLDVVQQDRSVLDFIFADHTFVNATLARHYGMPAPSGGSNEWVRVDHASQYARGGLLPMAVFQTRNAPGLRTSPVKRGYWVARRLLGEQIPPPPPLVGELPNDEAQLGTRTLREALVKHREDKSCAACHARFDSFGLVFEGYGPIGEVRTKDLAGHPVDTRATFPDGTEGAGFSGLRDYLRGRRSDDFLDNLCRKLLAYALGRTLQLSDDSTVAEMRSHLAAHGQHFSSLIETIVTSPQFLNQRSGVQLSKP